MNVGFWLGAGCAPSSIPGHGMVEVVIGDASDGWRDEEVVAHFRAVAEAAGRSPASMSNSTDPGETRP